MLKQLAKYMVLPLVVLGTVFNLNISEAEGRGNAVQFVCGAHEGEVAIIARHPAIGDLVFIVLESVFHYRSGYGYAPQPRCSEVAARFQRNQIQGTLNYIIPSKINNIPVLCASSTKNNTQCSNETLLFTLRHYDDANKIIQMIGVRNLPAELSTEEYMTGETPLQYHPNGYWLIDVEMMLLEASQAQPRNWRS